MWRRRYERMCTCPGGFVYNRATMWRGARVYPALIAAATASRIALAHDLVTPPSTAPSSAPKVLLSTSTEAEPGPGPTRAQSAGRVLLDLRTGWGLPLGEARSFATGRGAADVAVGYETVSGRSAGITGGMSSLDASLAGLRETTFQFGIDLGYRPPVRGAIEPWIALGFAWQILWLARADFSMKAVGPEFPIVRLGAEYRTTDGMGIGPFAAFAYRRYDPVSVQGITPLELTSVTRRDAWIVLGISASWSLSR